MASQPATAEAAESAPAVDAATTLYPDDAANINSTNEGAPAEPDGGAEQLDGGEPTAEDIAAVEAQVEEVAPPNSWPAEDAEIFKTIPRDAQEVIKRREAERDRQVYAKGQEVRKVEGDAREAVLKIQNNYMTGIQSLLGQAPEPADHRLLTTGQEADRNVFFQQEAAVRQWQTQQQALQSHLSEVQQHAQAIEEQHRQALYAQTNEALERELGETWSEPSKRQKFLSDLEPIGGELGYSRDLMAQADATDILALKRAHEWKQKAAKWDDLQKRKMTDVRAARQIPPKVTQPGAAGASQAGQVKDTRAILYPDDVRR